MDWFTSDFHFGHANIIKYSNRPFNSVKEMDDAIIDGLNQDVMAQDTLYFLGDFAFSTHDAIKEYRARINCSNIVFIYGNHDQHIRRNKDLQRLFSGTHELLEIYSGKQAITLCHYSMRVWNKSHHGAWHLYGHSHGTLEEDPKSLSFDVGVDCCDYLPLSFDMVADYMSQKDWQPPKFNK